MPVLDYQRLAQAEEWSHADRCTMAQRYRRPRADVRGAASHSARWPAAALVHIQFDRTVLRKTQSCRANATPRIGIAANHANGKFLGRNEQVHINLSN